MIDAIKDLLYIEFFFMLNINLFSLKRSLYFFHFFRNFFNCLFIFLKNISYLTIFLKKKTLKKVKLIQGLKEKKIEI